MLKIIILELPKHINDAKRLLQDYAETRPNDPALTNFPLEIAHLPGAYSPPTGCFLIGYFEKKPVGCVALHKWSEGVCEMKRLYVQPQNRGSGFGRKLVEAIIKQAKIIGYSRIYLDTIPSMEKAQNLYRAIGFKEILPYRFNPNKGTLFFELRLTD